MVVGTRIQNSSGLTRCNMKSGRIPVTRVVVGVVAITAEEDSVGAIEEDLVGGYRGCKRAPSWV